MLRKSDFKSIALQVPTIYTIAFSLLCIAIGSLLLSAPRRNSIIAPTLDLSPRKQKQRWRFDAAGMIQECYSKFPGQVFQLWTSEGPDVFIPPNLLDEIKGFPDNVLSILDAFAEFFQHRHTTFAGPDNPYWIEWSRLVLAKNVVNYIPIMTTELHHALGLQFENYADWEPIQVLPKMTQIVAAITSGIFVGPDLCREPRWINTIINNTKDFLTAAILLKFWPPWLRYLVKFTMPQIWRVWQHNKTARKMVSKALERPGYDDKHVDAVHGISAMVPENRKTDYSFQANCQLGLAAAGIHTTARMICHVLFDLATHPEYLPILREEIYSSSKPEGYDLEYFNSLKKMDSFMKESMRLHGGSIASFRRKVLRPTTLSDGTYLPSGTYISVPTTAVSHDAKFFPNPDTFDGLRFYNMRQRSPADANKHQLTTLENSATYFGGGRHGCPGRTFASVEAKMIISTLILKYDFKLKEEDGTPREFQFQSLLIVNPAKEILVRDRVDA